MLPAIEREGLLVTDIEILRLHYADTLKAWRDRFLARREETERFYDERFCRMWELYLASSEMAFREEGMMERLWYVACTRARDLLIVPCLPSADSHSWCRIVDLGHEHLPELDLSRLPDPKPEPDAGVINEQTAERFAAEAVAVATASPALTWPRPSDHDPDRAMVTEGAVDPANETAEVEITLGAGRLRGILLHKLMEEFLTGELVEDETTVTTRADELLQQLVAGEPDAGDLPEPAELAKTALRTLHLPEIASLRPTLVPELAVWSECEGELLAGRADATAYESAAPAVVLDWKSDIAPTPHDRAQYRVQLQEYMTAIGAGRGAVVYMSRGEIAWV